jgi:hypothetical protein
MLRLVNPRKTGGVVHYELDGIAHSLRPGEYQEIPPETEHKIEFHRGDDWGDTKLVLRKGVYEFNVDDTGWKLNLTQEDFDSSLLHAP